MTDEYVILPAAPDPEWPRYSMRPFPAYRFVPGRVPHPRRDPDGHSFGLPEPEADPIFPGDWKNCDTYLFGIDLFNYAYWWECHEQLEALWHAVGHRTQEGQFLQGIIQVAAGNLQEFRGSAQAGRKLAVQGLRRHKGINGIYMGVDVAQFAMEVVAFFDGKSECQALIRLEK